MNPFTTEIKQSISEQRNRIINHPVYQGIKGIEDMRKFMEYHVYAVWDFMSLLKALQSRLTCVSTPWFPVGSPDVRFLINEIVVGEESDINEDGIRQSHFEMYLSAMTDAGADTNGIRKFIAELQDGKSIDEAFETAKTPTEARDFVNFTFRIINSNKTHLISSIFTFGREDLIPGMFMAMINDLNLSQPEKVKAFKYYLDRHIEVDGDHHSHLAIQMTEELCGNEVEKWNEVQSVVRESLDMRIHLWNGVLKSLTSKAQAH